MSTGSANIIEQQTAILSAKKTRFVVIAPRNDITKTVFVISSVAKQSADTGSPGIATAAEFFLQHENFIGFSNKKW